MKTNELTRLAMLLAIAPLVPIASAAEEPATKPAAAKTSIEKNTIASTIHDSATFSILNKALVATGLDVTLGSKGAFTVFAPTDEAFEKLPEGTLDTLMLPENKEKLRSLLMYHVVPGTFLAADLKDGEVKTSNGEKVEIDLKSDTVQIEDSMVSKADVSVSNGVIHTVDKVMVPESLDGFADLDED
ncbi:fasciclin domain-containing protein [Luteolibacter marinus]|uniref:fasciclin domain-containing protein n=1 Tax=Luteolibacter marinus TaxID=2776705 RepID=UPI001866F037|nr:fasciclin domain-containing protein [Luteolibacter marinus]